MAWTRASERDAFEETRRAALAEVELGLQTGHGFVRGTARHLAGLCGQCAGPHAGPTAAGQPNR
jgi:hypothetical protein